MRCATSKTEEGTYLSNVYDRHLNVSARLVHVLCTSNSRRSMIFSRCGSYGSTPTSFGYDSTPRVSFGNFPRREAKGSYNSVSKVCQQPCALLWVETLDSKSYEKSYESPLVVIEPRVSNRLFNVQGARACDFRTVRPSVIECSCACHWIWIFHSRARAYGNQNVPNFIKEQFPGKSKSKFEIFDRCNEIL